MLISLIVCAKHFQSIRMSKNEAVYFKYVHIFVNYIYLYMQKSNVCTKRMNHFQLNFQLLCYTCVSLHNTG